MVKTYACKQATPISRPIKANTTVNGSTDAIPSSPPTESIVKEKPLKARCKPLRVSSRQYDLQFEPRSFYLYFRGVSEKKNGD